MGAIRDIATVSFEGIECIVPSCALKVFLIYRLIPSKKNQLKSKDFHTDFQSLVDEHLMSNCHLLIAGDFNIHWDITDNSERSELFDYLTSLGLCQHVTESTHIEGPTIDLVMTKSDGKFLSNVSVDSLLSDHHAIHFDLNFQKPPTIREKVCYRKLKFVDHDQLDQDLHDSELLLSPGKEAESLVHLYNKVLGELLDAHALTKETKLTVKPRAPWYTPQIAEAKKLRRKYERQ